MLTAFDSGNMQSDRSLVWSRTFAPGSIVNVLIKLKSLGKAASTIDSTSRRLSYLSKHVSLNDPEKIALFIASLSRANSYKANLVKAYNWYVKVHGLSWEKPKYHWEQQNPKIPTTETLMSIIERATRKYQVIFTVLMESLLQKKAYLPKDTFCQQ